MTNGTTRRIVIYVRISKDRDNQTSTATQEKVCRAYAEAQGWTVVEVLVDKGRSAYSGKDRPGFRRALGLIEAGAADGLLVWALDRAVRSTVDLDRLLARLEKHGAGFASATQPIDTTSPMGVAMVKIIGVMAELESAMKGERISEYHRDRKRAGRPAAGPRPYGYRRVEGGLIVDQAEAQIVREIVTRFLDGETMNALARDLNARGVTTSTGRKWYAQSVRDLLDNPTHAGRMKIDGVEMAAEWTAIITPEERAKVCERRQAGYKPRAKAAPMMLTGVLYCAEHGAPMWGLSTIAGKRRYRCSADGCYVGVAEELADRFVSEYLLAKVDGDAWAALRARAEGVDPAEALRAKLARLVADWSDDLIDDDSYAASRARLNERIAEAEASGPISASLPRIEDLGKGWEGLDLDARRAVLGVAFGRITLAPADADRNRGRFDPDRFTFDMR